MSLKKKVPDMFCKNDVLKNFTNFIGKHLCWSLFLLKRDSNTGVFCNNIYFEEHLRTTASVIRIKASGVKPVLIQN